MAFEGGGFPFFFGAGGGGGGSNAPPSIDEMVAAWLAANQTSIPPPSSSAPPPTSSEPPPTSPPVFVSPPPPIPDIPAPPPATVPPLVTPGGWSDAWGGALGGLVRRHRLTQIERAARELARGVERGLARGLERVLRGPPDIPRGPPRGGLPVPRIPDAPARWGLGALGGLVLGTIWEGWPVKPLGSGELPPPEKMTPADIEVMLPPMDASRYGRRIDFPNAPRGAGRSIYGGGGLAPLPPLGTPDDVPAARQRGEGALEKVIRDRARAAIDKAVPGMGSVALPRRPAEPSTVGPPRPPAPVPATVGVGSRTTGSGRARRVLTSPLGMMVGAALLGALVSSRSRGSRSASSSGLLPVAPPTTPGSQNVTPPALGALTAVNGGFVGLLGGTNYCVPRPRGPRRKCLQRAPVKYTGGPRKGKSAGTKCVRFARAK